MLAIRQPSGPSLRNYSSVLGFVKDHVVFDFNLLKDQEGLRWAPGLQDVVQSDSTLHFLLVWLYPLLLLLLLCLVRVF